MKVRWCAAALEHVLLKKGLRDFSYISAVSHVNADKRLNAVTPRF